MEDNTEAKKNFIQQHMDDSVLKNADDATREEYRRLVEEGVAAEWPVALHAKAYGCYGGNSVFETDWNESKRCLLKLCELTGEPGYYNTLGYIFYYGRCNGGVPEYDEAFKYFSVAAAHGWFEALYKLADMFAGGKGVPKSLTAASQIITNIYDENLDNFCREIYDSKFADVALRMGGIFENGWGVEKDAKMAYYYYTQACFAIEKRMEHFDYYGDSKVKRNAYESRERVKKLLPDDYFTQYVTTETPEPLALMMSCCTGIDMTVDIVKNHYVMHVKMFSGEGEPSKTLLTYPEMGYCELTDETDVYLMGVESLSTYELPMRAFITRYYYDSANGKWDFLCSDQVMFSVKCKEFIFYQKT